MGNCATMKDDSNDPIEASKNTHFYRSLLANQCKSNFSYQCVIGRGGFGQVNIKLSFYCIGMESRKEENRAGICDERDVESTHHNQEICEFSHE
jgi:hypothetical protein